MDLHFKNVLRIPTGLLAVLLAVVVLTAAFAQTAPSAQLVARPLSQDDINNYKLPATTERSAGLFTVGLGQPAYLEAEIDSTIPAANIISTTWTLTYKPSGSNAMLTDSPLGSNIPVFEPSDRLIFQVAGRKLLRPDVVGAYVVTAAIATTTGTVNLAQTIVGAKYVGIAACSVCHSGGLADVKVPAWSKTLHAEVFKDNIDGVTGETSYSSSCWGCHTVAYDTSATVSNGGFSDLMKQLGWMAPTTIQAGNFAAMPAALQNVANIQCENCHGPGSEHAGSGGDMVAISVDNTSGVCNQCHSAATHHVKGTEWNNSMHAVTTRDPSGAGREACVGCHTGNGFVQRIAAANAGQTFVPADTSYSAIGCQSCHEPHGQTAPTAASHQIRTLMNVTLADGTLVKNGGEGLLCMNCHQSRQNAVKYVDTTPGSAHFGPHEGPQSDMLQGVNGYTYGKTIPSSAHSDVVADTCVTCHMQQLAASDPQLGKLGGHTFSPSLAATATTPARNLVGACQNCHGPDVTTFDFALFDYNDDGVIEGVQTEVQHLLDQLSTMLPPDNTVKKSLTIDSTWNSHQLQAAYNWLYVNNDGSRGIHNTAYTVGLLKASIVDLGGTPGATTGTK